MRQGYDEGETRERLDQNPPKPPEEEDTQGSQGRKWTQLRPQDVVFVCGYTRPGREQRPKALGGGAWPVEWQLRKIATFGPPFSIYLETGVGQGALHPTAANPHLTLAFQQVQSWLLRNKVSCPYVNINWQTSQNRELRKVGQQLEHLP